MTMALMITQDLTSKYGNNFDGLTEPWPELYRFSTKNSMLQLPFKPMISSSSKDRFDIDFDDDGVHNKAWVSNGSNILQIYCKTPSTFDRITTNPR